MKPRLRRIRREFLCISMAFLLIMLVPTTGLRSISIPVVQAQEGGPTFSTSDLRFDGSRYYYDATMFVSYISVDWRIYLADNIDYIVNEVAFLNANVDSSVFYVEPGSCIGFLDCATSCNNCVTGLRNRCKLAAVGEAGLLALGAAGVIACIVGAAATLVGLGIAILCAVGGGVAVGAAAAGIRASFEICKAGAVDTCNALNPGCVCRG